MSEGHGQTGHGPGGAPVSHGISPVMWLFIALSIVIVCMQGGFVIGSSGMGHVWPSGDSTKVQLPESAR